MRKSETSLTDVKELSPSATHPPSISDGNQDPAKETRTAKGNTPLQHAYGSCHMNFNPSALCPLQVDYLYFQPLLCSIQSHDITAPKQMYAITVPKDNFITPLHNLL